MKRGLALFLLALTAAATPHKVVRSSAALDFSYEWPAEAVAIPALDLRLYNEAKRDLAEAQKNAREDQALAKQQKRPFNQYYYSAKWESAGETSRLLSLEGGVSQFSGGAHPNGTYWALLWDRKLNGAIAVSALFTTARQFSTVTRASYCRKLDAERRIRREGEGPSLLGSDDPFDKCHKYSELAIYPADKNQNGRFDRIVFVASPYVAGPYVEGEYEVALPVTPALIASLKPEYRASFELPRR